MYKIINQFYNYFVASIAIKKQNHISRNYRTEPVRKYILYIQKIYINSVNSKYLHHFIFLAVCPSHETSQPTYFPAKNCSFFWECSNGKAFFLECPEGLEFDPVAHVCASPNAAGCTSDGWSRIKDSNPAFSSNIGNLTWFSTPRNKPPAESPTSPNFP